MNTETREELTAEELTDLIESATAHIKEARRLRLRTFEQCVRTQRRQLQDQLDEMLSA